MTLEEAEKLLTNHFQYLDMYSDGTIVIDGSFDQEFLIALGLWLEQKPEGWEKIFK